MLDFTAAHYLGFVHDHRSLRPWSKLTTGVPAALHEPDEAQAVADRLAALQESARGLLGRSTLHLFWDLGGMVTTAEYAIMYDSGSYAIARWGVERAAGRGVPVHAFAHHDAQDLKKHLKRLRRGRRPLVIADGVCTMCGCEAPLPEYAALAAEAGGLLVVDDSQALGLLGAGPSDQHPYGHGGGGSLPWCDIAGSNVLAISSLAKAFGVPLAAVSGSTREIERFAENSETRVHCSPPSLAALHAAERALALNETQGEQRRARLVALVRRFRWSVHHCAGVRLAGGLFPVQTLAELARDEAVAVARRLRRAGVAAVLRQDHRQRPRLSFIITAVHTPADVDAAAIALAAALETGTSARIPLSA